MHITPLGPLDPNTIPANTLPTQVTGLPNLWQCLCQTVLNVSLQFSLPKWVCQANKKKVTHTILKPSFNNLLAVQDSQFPQEVLTGQFQGPSCAQQ